MKFGGDNFDEGNKWRLHCKRYLEDVECDYDIIACNPNDYFNFTDYPPKYESQREVMNLDLYKLRHSDLVIVNFNDKRSLGTMAEIAIAHDRGIPVIGINVSGHELHPWQVEMCERIFTNINEMLYYVEEFYLK